jgi:hypothetical protein
MEKYGVISDAFKYSKNVASGIYSVPEVKLNDKKFRKVQKKISLDEEVNHFSQAFTAGSISVTQKMLTIHQDILQMETCWQQKFEILEGELEHLLSEVTTGFDNRWFKGRKMLGITVEEIKKAKEKWSVDVQP